MNTGSLANRIGLAKEPPRERLIDDRDGLARGRVFLDRPEVAAPQDR